MQDFESWASEKLPEQFDKRRNASRLEDSQQPLTMVTQVMQRTGSTSCGLNIVGVAHGAHQGGHHLRGVHDGVAAGLLLAELVDHHGRLAHNHLGKTASD